MGKYPLKRIPRPEGGTEYDEWQDHPLNGCPQYILDAAREVIEDQGLPEAIEKEEAHSIADAIVSTLRERGYING